MSGLLKKLSLLLFASPALFVDRVEAFTNGTLLPAYICGPPNDGLPKSLGGVIPYFVLNTNPTFTPQPMEGNMVLPNRPLDAEFGGSLNNTKQLVAGFHNAGVNGGFVAFTKVIGINITAIPAANTPNFVPTPNVIVPGLQHTVRLFSTPGDLGVFNADTALDGAIVYAQIPGNNAAALPQRVGSFVQTGENMKAWAACGPNNVGVVHFQLLSDNGEYDGLVWAAPANLKAGTQVTFKGAAVTDGGFGAHSTTFTVAAAPAAVPNAPVAKQALKLGNAKVVVFFADTTKNAANPVKSFTVTVGFKDANGAALSNGFRTYAQPQATTKPTAAAATTAAAAATTKPAATVAAVTTAPAANNAAAGPKTVTFTVAKSPAELAIADILAKATAAGVTAANIATMTFTVTATNAIGTSAPSNTLSVAFKAPAAAANAATKVQLFVATNYNSAAVPPPSAAILANAQMSQTGGDSNNYAAILALCDNQYSQQLASFNMADTYDDLDNACAWQDIYTSQLVASAGINGTINNMNSGMTQSANGVLIMASTMVAYYATRMFL